MNSGRGPSVNRPYIQWLWIIIGLLAFFVLYYFGGHIYRRTWRAFINREATMDTLVAMGTGTGVALYIIYTVVRMPMWILPMARHVYFDTATILIAFITFGAVLEIRARVRWGKRSNISWDYALKQLVLFVMKKK